MGAHKRAGAGSRVVQFCSRNSQSVTTEVLPRRMPSGLPLPGVTMRSTQFSGVEVDAWGWALFLPGGCLVVD